MTGVAIEEKRGRQKKAEKESSVAHIYLLSSVSNGATCKQIVNNSVIVKYLGSPDINLAFARIGLHAAYLTLTPVLAADSISDPSRNSSSLDPPAPNPVVVR